MQLNFKNNIPKKEYLYDVENSDEENPIIFNDLNGVYVLYDCRGYNFFDVLSHDFSIFNMKAIQLK